VLNAKDKEALLPTEHTVSPIQEFKTTLGYGISAGEIYLQNHFSKAKAHNQQLRSRATVVSLPSNQLYVYKASSQCWD